MQEPDWDKFGGLVDSDFDDGHIPETIKAVSSSSHPNYSGTRLVTYPRFHRDRSAQVQVVDNAVSEELADALYQRTVQEGQPWGTYVTMNDIRSQRPASPQRESGLSIDELALHAATTFLTAAMHPELATERYHADANPASPNKDRSSTSMSSLWTTDDSNLAHGVAVWALAADEGSQVPYHIDYAEQIRYESNTIVVPVLAGTLQCSRVNCGMLGGDYAVHLNGLDHYHKHGYKGAKSPVSITSFISSASLGCEDDKNWKVIPYRFNRMICQSGHLPHLSTSIESIGESDTSVTGSYVKLQRVIVGFNVFLRDVGAAVREAPEHSAAFRQRVQERQRQRRPVIQKQQPAQTLSFDMIRKNPKLANLLILAKRQRIKEDLGKAQAVLDKQIIEMLLNCTFTSGYLTISYIMDHCSKQDGAWPNPTDVFVHVKRSLKEGRLQLLLIDNSEPISPDTLVAPIDSTRDEAVSY